MKKALLGIQILFIFVFSGLFVATFTHVETIINESKDAVSQKVTASASSKVDLAEEILQSNAAEKILKPYQIEAAKDEIRIFRENPSEYVASIVKGDHEIPKGKIDYGANPLKKALTDKIFSWKTSLKVHFENTLSNLIRDIRIFLISNIVALSVAAAVVLRPGLIGKKAQAVSAIVTLVVATSIVTYVDRNWLYAIILNNYAGYGYPLSLLLTSLWLCYEYIKGNRKNA